MRFLPFFLILILTARAEPVTLSRAEAFELHTAIAALSPGLTPETTLAAADTLNALEATAKGVRQGYAKLLQLQQTAESAKTPEAVFAFHEADTKFSAAVDEKKTYDLALFTLTKEDVKGANITVAQVATIKRLLRRDPVTAPPVTLVPLASPK